MAVRIWLAIACIHFTQAAGATSFICPTRIELGDVSDLEEAYAVHGHVFVANVHAIVDEEGRGISWIYDLVAPALKGNVPATGKLEMEADFCNAPQVALEATFLIFLDKLGEFVGADNSVAIVYGEGAVVEKWILEWVAQKVNVL